MRALAIGTGVAVALLVTGMALWVMFGPAWTLASLRDQARTELDRELTAESASLSLFPLTLRLDGVRLGSPEEIDDAFLTARSLTIPVTLGQLLTHRAEFAEARLEGAELAFLIDERGTASFAFPALKSPRAVKLTVVDGGFRFHDARSGQAFAVRGMNLAAGLSSDGEVTLAGTVEINGRLVKAEAFARSLPRIAEDGSPFELNLDAPDLGFSFTGRLAAAKVLSLTGTASLAGDRIHQALKWAGMATGRDGGGAFALTGALDTAGRGFVMTKADLSLGGNRASGVISLDGRGEVPKFEAVLKAAKLDLTPFVAAGGSTADDWGRNPLGLGALKAFDATVSVEAETVNYGGLASGPAQVALTITGGKLVGQLNFAELAGGRAGLETAIDASQSPPTWSMAIGAEGVEAARLLPLAGIDFMAGRGAITASLGGAGNTVQEMIGTLKGEAALTLSEGQLLGANIEELLAAASQRIAEGWSGPSARTGFASLDAAITISDGIAVLSRFKLDSPNLQVTATGDIDLLRRAIDLRADPRLVQAGGETAGLPVLVVVAGPWANPRIYPDMPNILTSTAKAFEQLKAAGLPPAPGN